LSDDKNGDLKQDGVPSALMLDDVQLSRLAREWRDRAQQGDPIAPGIADAFEAEIRRRERRIDDAPEVRRVGKSDTAVSRRWWKFW